MTAKPEHAPTGDPCTKCGQAAANHRPVRVRRNRPLKKEHQYVGTADTCERCGLERTFHINSRYKTHDLRCIGIDGEGQGRDQHNYVMISAADSTGKYSSYCHNPNGLSTVECLEFLLSLPQSKGTKYFAFGFGYDWTKIITDLSDAKIYYLMRPELRSKEIKGVARRQPMPVHYKDFKLNHVGSQYTICKGVRSVTIWDAFKFFQARFVAALEAWKVGSPELLARMTLMKNQRAEFDKLNFEDILAYNKEECMCLAQLMHKLIAAHEAVDLKLKAFHGAGSTSKALLQVMNIKSAVVPTEPEMQHAVLCAFAGGRFENSVIGDIPGPIYSKDISSAYPYQTTFLPDFRKGTWQNTKKRSDLDKWNVRAAVVRYRLTANNDCYKSWGPFPFRLDDGSIVFPIESGGGWVWLSEYLAGERLFNNVKFLEAYAFTSDDLIRPFAAMPAYYNERVRIGKDGPGIVLKLGMNGCYGSLAQSVGSPQFADWKWAGIITAGCRAQILEVLGLHQDRSNLLMTATDGIYTLEKFDNPIPKPTYTEKTGKPLGGWEEKTIPQGAFLARPGVYFPLNPTDEEIDKVRGRGVGRKAILDHWKDMVKSWDDFGEHKTVRLPDISRFCGAKTCVHRSGKRGEYRFSRAAHTDGKKPRFGNWIQMKVQLSYSPLPKRAAVDRDGKSLTLRTFPQDLESLPYKKGLKGTEGTSLEYSEIELLEQPDPSEFGGY
jgi:DNA polymerase type B, organellar and viral